MSNTICATVVRIVCSVCKPSFVKCTRGLGGGQSRRGPSEQQTAKYKRILEVAAESCIQCWT